MYKRKQLNRLTKLQLVSICKENNLRPSDNKVQLVSTILAWQESGISEYEYSEYDRYRMMTCSELRQHCKKLRLSTSGNKFDLITRLIGGWMSK